MKVRSCAAAMLAATVLVMLLVAPAQARRSVQPLNQYVVSGKITPEELARKGYDLTEAQVKGRRGFAIVATPAQAADLQTRGVTVRPLRGRARTARRAAAAAA